MNDEIAWMNNDEWKKKEEKYEKRRTHLIIMK